MQQAAFALFDQSTVEIYNTVVETIRPHFRSDSLYDVVCLGFSGGKDSTLLLALTLEAARRESVASGAHRPLVVMNSDTRFENPLVVSLVDAECARLFAFARQHALDVHFVTGRPTLAASWAVKVISGNALPPIPGGRGACTVDWKIEPLRRALKDWMRTNGLDNATTLKLTGTRFSESNERGRKMALRGESATRPTVNPSGEWLLSPIADLDTDAVWDLISGIRSGLLPASYTDFDDLLAVYSSAGGASCPLLADYRMGGTDLGSCEARTGCWCCTRVNVDTSLQNMLSEHPWLKPLYALREWVAAILWDYDRRSWVGRTIDEHGYIKVQPDGFSSETTAELLRYALSIDADEDAWARRHGGRRRFAPLIGLDGLILIDFGWSLHGMQARPYEAWRIYRDIVEDGARYVPPTLVPQPRGEVPSPRYLFVGEGWQEARRFWAGGLRDLLAEALEADTPAAFEMRLLADGREIPEIERGNVTSVDLDSEEVCNYLDYMHEENMELAQRGLLKHHDAVRQYMTFGVVKHPDHGQLDMILRRSLYRETRGMGRDQLPSAVMTKTLSMEEYEQVVGEMRAEQQLSLDLPLAA